MKFKKLKTNADVKDMEQRAINILKNFDGLNPSDARSCFAYAMTLLFQIQAKDESDPKKFINKIRAFIDEILASMEHRI